jgi:hypothetical protein
MRLFLPYVLYTVGAYPNHRHIKIIVKTTCAEKRKKGKKIKEKEKVSTDMD